jgi:SAM-dependent methyltransferase
MPKLYSELAKWWPLLSPPEDYADEAAFFRGVLLGAGLPSSPTFLELGCGGGNNAFHLKTLFVQVTLTDISPNMLAMSRTLNRDCEHLEGDMRTLRLGSAFDVVFIHDAIDYMTSRQDLHQAMQTAFIHCQAGGVALFVPDYVSETFQHQPSMAVPTPMSEAYGIWNGAMIPTTLTPRTPPNSLICCGKAIKLCGLSMTNISAGYFPGQSGCNYCVKWAFALR